VEKNTKYLIPRE